MLPGAPDGADERATSLQVLQQQLRGCRACQEAGLLRCARPVVGEQGLRKVLLLGQAPGVRSTAAGLPFAGPSGRVLELWLLRAGFEPGALRRDIYLSSVTRCDPGRSTSGAGDRPPSDAERVLCSHWWRSELALLQPRVVLLAGKLAIAEFYPPGPLEALVGTWRKEGDGWLLPLPHPSGVSRWLNDPSHRMLVERALAQLAAWRVTFALDEPATGR